MIKDDVKNISGCLNIDFLMCNNNIINIFYINYNL